MRFPKLSKEIIILLSYSWMLIACYLFDWKPFYIFFSYLLELFVLTGFYVIIRKRDEQKNPQNYRRAQPIENVLIGSIPLFLFQYFALGWASVFIYPDENFILKDLILTSTTLIIVLQFVFAYAAKIFSIQNDKTAEKLLKGNLLYQALVLTTTNVTALVIVIVFSIESLLPVLTVMVIIRASMEIYFARKMELI
jgi:hypothetical protein